MSDISFEVKQSKIINVLLIVLCSFTEMFFGGVLIFSIILIAKQEYKTFNNPMEQLGGTIFVLFSCVFIIITIFALEIYLLREAKTQVDVYTSEKMYRKKCDKIVFELEYSKIESIKEGFFAGVYSFCICCYEPIIKKNGKKGPKTLIEYYTIKDRKHIKEIISNSTSFNSKH